MKNQKPLYLVLIIILNINFITNAQKGSFALTINDTNQIKALKEYVQLLKSKRQDLSDNKFVVMFYEDRNGSGTKDDPFSIDVHVIATKTNYYKYFNKPLIGYFWLEGVLFIVENNSKYLHGSLGMIAEIDKVVGDKLEEYIPTKEVDTFIKRNGVDIPVKKRIVGETKTLMGVLIVFDANKKSKFLHDL